MTERSITAAPLAAGLLATWQFAGADPNTADVAACNAEAREAVRGRTAFPTARDEARAAEARLEPTSPGPNASPSGSQIAGMDAEGAKNAVYRAAYRVCMRKKGF